MSTPTKVGFGLLGISAFIVPGVLVIITAEPPSITVENASDEYKGKFGEDFKYHLVDATAGKNQIWWDWSFKYRWQIDPQDETEDNFRNISDGNALREKCKEAYSKDTKKDIHTTGKSEYEKAIWRYCALEGKKPYTGEELKRINGELGGTSSGETIGKKYSKDLISANSVRNNKFWKIQEIAFFKSKYKEETGNKHLEGDSDFKKLYENRNHGTLRETCSKVYSYQDSDENNRKHALMFCSLMIKES